MRVLNQSANKKPQYLPQIPQIYADETQKPKTTLTSPICLSLRDNAALAAFVCVICVICGRIHARVLNLLAQMKPQKSPADLADLRRQNPKQQNNNNSINLKQPVFLCDIMQLCCIPLRHLRYLRENIHASVLNLLAQMSPKVSRRSRRFTQTKPQNDTATLVDAK